MQKTAAQLREEKKKIKEDFKMKMEELK